MWLTHTVPMTSYVILLTKEFVVLKTYSAFVPLSFSPFHSSSDPERPTLVHFTPDTSWVRYKKGGRGSLKCVLCVVDQIGPEKVLVNIPHYSSRLTLRPTMVLESVRYTSQKFGHLQRFQTLLQSHVHLESKRRGKTNVRCPLKPTLLARNIIEIPKTGK